MAKAATMLHRTQPGRFCNWVVVADGGGAWDAVRVASVDELKAALRAHGLRATGARVAVLELLLAATRPLSHSEVNDGLAARGFDRATLYRNLSDLVEVGLAKRSDHGDHVWRFELASEKRHQEHPHLLCTECGTVACLPIESVAVTGVAHVEEVQLRGLCDTCAD